MRLRESLLALCLACSSGARGDGGKGVPPPPAPKGVIPAGPLAQAKAIAVPMPLIAASSQIAADEAVAAPWSLTASDGSGLLVTRVDARAVVQGPLAFTELHLYFANTEDRTREGTFAITLPPGAAVSRFAMENEGQWMEAEVVEKQLARRAYEDFLHRKQDPALMEKAAGNQFTARVFPIAPRSQKHLVLSFSQELPGARYTLPLRGLPKVERVDVELATTRIDGTRDKETLAKRNWQPDADFVSGAPSVAEALMAGTYVVAQLAPFDQAQVAADAPTAMTLLVDTSASRALGFERYVRTLRELVSSLAAKHAGLAIEVIAFDQDTQSIYAGPATGFADAHLQALIARGAAGASDLGQALAAIKAPRQRVVVVTDAVLTAGVSGDELVARAKQLAAAKVERLDVVMAGGIRDEELATKLVTAGLPRAGAVLDLDAGLGDVASGLGERVITDVAVDVAGATWVYPRTIQSARPGKRMMVYAKLAKPAQTVEVTIGGKRRAVGLAAGTPALVERAAATAEIAELESKLATAAAAERAALKADIARRSVAARVISSQTSLLVLESEGDYARYGIDRRSLADILVVGPRGIEQTRRTTVLAVADPTPTTPTAKQPAEKNKDRGGAKEDLKKEIATADAFKLEEGAAGRADDKPAADPSEPSASGPEGGDAITGAAAGSASFGGAPGAPPPPPAPAQVARSTSRPAPMTEAEAPRRRIARDRDGDANASDDEAGAGAREAWPPRNAPAPLKGALAEIDRALRRGQVDAALAKARAWHHREPGDVLALIGLGEALEAKRDLATAARIYGSIIDLFPGRADLRRFAGERLERIGADARGLAVDTYRRAVEERPDHMTGHRLLAYALLRAGNHAEAFAAILAGLDRDYPSGRFEGGQRVLTDDAGLIGAAYAAAHPGKRAEIAAALEQRGTKLPTRPSTRFIMYWETDANDVDFHIQDARGGHAFYGSKQLRSGGELYADITTGYGPECFAIEGTPTAGPYRMSINYYSQGPMGYGMGLLQIVKHDGKGTLSFQDRPYVIMADHAYVDLGTYKP